VVNTTGQFAFLHDPATTNLMKINSITISYAVVAVTAILVVKSLLTSWIGLQQEVSEPKQSVQLSVVASEPKQIAYLSGITGSSQAIVHNASAGVAQIDSVTTQPPIARNENVPESSLQQQGSFEGAPRVVQFEPSPDSAQVAAASPSLIQNGNSANTTLPSIGSSIEFHPASSVRTTSASVPVVSTAQPVSIPAAFGDPTAAGITAPDQVQQVAQIAQKFTDPILSNQVSAPGFTPSSPSYQKAWNSGVKMADAVLRQQLGWQAFEQMQQSAKAP